MKCLFHYSPVASRISRKHFLDISRYLHCMDSRGGLQYMPKKPIKRELKIWMRLDSTNGYICQFQLYTGKEGDKADVGLGGKVVTALSRDLVGKNYHLYMDNFFSSIALFHQLLDDGIYACGTLHSNRKFFPEDLKPLVKRGPPKRGDIQVREIFK